MKTLNYGGGSREEMEVVIRVDAQDQLTHICSTWPAWSRRLEKMYGNPYKYIERDNLITSAFWQIPLESVRFRRRKRQATGRPFQTGRISPETTRHGDKKPGLSR